jgi:selenocysteine-specific elongation factor
LRKMQTMEWLETLRDASAEERVLLRAMRRGTEGLSLQGLMSETGLARKAVERLLQPLVQSRRLLQVSGDILLGSSALDAACDAILSAMHASGIKRSELRTRTGLRPEILDLALERLARGGRLRLDGESVGSIQAGKAPSAPDATLSAIAAIYRQAGLSAPLVSEVAATLKLKEAEMRGRVTLLLREKILVPMGSENLFIHHEALARLRSEISELHGQTVDVARFKQITGLSRKYAIPLLEYLDRQRITRKMGDGRLVI